MRNIILGLALVMISSCFGPKTPTELLKTMMDKRESNSLSRSYMTDITTGILHDELTTMDDETFNSFVSDLKIDGSKHKILSENCKSESECTVTYILTYNSLDDGKKSFTSEVKKVASLIKVDGAWKLSDMSNLKTYHESVEPINPLTE